MYLHIHFSKLLLFRGLIIVLVGVGFWRIDPQSTVHSSSSIQTQDIPRFEEGKCSKLFPDMFPWYSWDRYRQNRFRCGYLLTWESYDSQDPNKIIQLAVMETYPTTEPKPDPVIWLAGGPGSSGFGFKPGEAIKFTNYFGRGLIQFSQRGSYLSKPAALFCKEYHNVIIDNWEKPLGWEEWETIKSKALRDCLDNLNEKQAFEDIANFNSKFNALDVVYLIRTLGYGYGKANLYSGSYGTLLTQHVLALSPGDVRSVVLDGVAPLGIDWEARYPHNIQRSLDEIFKACKNDTNCNRAYPNLPDIFHELLGQLKDQPACISIIDGDATFSNVCLDDYGFLQALGQVLYNGENIKKVPRIIYAANNRDFKEIEEIGGNYYSYERNQDWPWGMYYAIYCAEFARFNPDDAGLSQGTPQLQNLYKASKQLIENVCPLYDPKGKSYGDTQITNNKIPALIFNGKFDPVTPPEYGRQVANTFSKYYEFTSQISAHGSISGDCAYSIMKNFFDDPTQSPDKRSCWTKEPQVVKFETSNNESSWWEELQQKIADTFDTWSQDFKTWWQEQQKKIVEALNAWWDEQQKKITDALNQWWQDVQRQLAQWLEQQFIEWLNQCCASAFLPVGILAGVWILRRNRRE